MIITLHTSSMGWSSIDTIVRYQSSSWNATAVLAERQRLHVSSGRRRVPAYREFIKNATNKSALAELICVYLTDTAPQILKEHQWLMLAGGFTNGQLVKVVEHTGVRERPELFSTHEEADTIDLATIQPRITVTCDDTDVLFLLICYCARVCSPTAKYT